VLQPIVGLYFAPL